MTKSNYRRPTHREFVLGALPGTISQISARAGVSRSTAVNWVKALRKAGEVRVSGWQKLPQGGEYVAIYALGSTPDAACKFAPLSSAERHQRYTTRQKKDEAYEIHRARHTARQRANRASKKPNSWFGALPGARASSMNVEGAC